MEQHDQTESLGEIFERMEKYGTWGEHEWQNYVINGFVKAHTPQQRIDDLVKFDRLLEQETKPSRETAEYIAKRRELEDWHRLLVRVGR